MIYKASAEAMIATTMERNNKGTSYQIANPGTLNASMPMKCMLQIPTPIARDPPRIQVLRM